MHKPQDELVEDLRQAAEKVIVGGRYHHYKNPDAIYKVLQLAVTEADCHVCVIYEAQYDRNLVFVRPLDNWLDAVDYYDKKVPRFALVAENS